MHLPTRLLIALAACGHPRRSAIDHPVPRASCAADGSDLDDPTIDKLLPTDKIASVTIHGAELGDLALETKAGASFDPSALRADVHALWRSAVASRIAVTATAVPNGYALAFEVSPARRVIRVELDGIARADVRQLALLEGTLHDRGRLARLVATTEASLRDHGYAHASLRATARTTCDGVIVRIAGTIGPRYRVGTIRVIGAAERIAPSELQDDFGHTNAPGASFRESVLDATLDRIVARERALGYFDATGKVEVTVDEPRRQIDAALSISHGPRYHIEIAITGGTPEERAIVAAAIPRAEPARDLDALEHAVSVAEKQLQPLGRSLLRYDEKRGDVYLATLTILPWGTP